MMPTADAPNKLSSWMYELGSLFLALLTVFFSFASGRLLGFEGAQLIGYSVGPLFVVVIVLAISRLIKGARTRRNTAKISFFTLLIVALVTVSGTMQAKYKRPPISTEFDRESLDVGEAQANALALLIQDSVSKGETRQLQPLYDGDRFMRKALRGRDTTSGELRDIALGASDAFKHGKLLEQMTSLVEDDGEFTFVKLYQKGQEPILQFRLTEESGNLHYFDFYIFKASDGIIRIDDLHYYNSGEPLSKQVVENATDLNTKSGSSSTEFETLQKAIQLAHQGRMEEGYSTLESLPDPLKQQRAVMRLRIQWGYQLEADQAENLLDEFKNKFPDDPSIVFSTFTAAIARNDLGRSASLIDDIYNAVNGDEYLLWYKAHLFVLQKRYQEATALLSEMEDKYKIDVASVAETRLLEEFLSSSDYKIWLNKRERRIRNRQ